MLQQPEHKTLMVATQSDTLTLKSFMNKSAQLSDLLVLNYTPTNKPLLTGAVGMYKFCKDNKDYMLEYFCCFLKRPNRWEERKKKRECIYLKQAKKNKHSPTYIFLRKVYEVLQINVISVCSDVVVYKEIKLVLDPVFENKC